ncbi:MAG: hemolysin family protein [Acidimicrobiales bacterium]
MIGLLVVAGVLLLVNGFFVAVEFALLAARRSRIEQLAAEGGARAQAAMKALKELSFMLAAAQLGITGASLGFGYVAEPAVAEILESALHGLIPDAALHTVAFLGGLTIVVFLHMVVGEMVPKNIALAEAEQSALWLALPMRAFTTVFKPLVVSLNVAGNAGLRLLGVEPRDELIVAHTNDEIAAMLAMSRSEGMLEEVEHALMSGALGFVDRCVSEVMVQRHQVVAVRVAATVEDIERIAVTSGHTRLPVHGRDLNDILGFIHTKDLLGVPTEARRLPLQSSSIRPMLIVPAERTLQELLLTMRRAHRHFAVVTNHLGETVGIVTLEDLLEALISPSNRVE